MNLSGRIWGSRKTAKLSLPLLIGSLVALSSCGSSSAELPAQDIGSPSISTDDGVQGGGGSSSASAGGEEYESIVRPVNCALKELTALEQRVDLGGNTVDASGVSQLQGQLQIVATARREAAGQLSALPWPDSVAAQVQEMAQLWFGVAKLEEGLATAPTMDDWNALMGQYNTSFSPSAAGLSSTIRAGLGLPDNGADYTASLKCD